MIQNSLTSFIVIVVALYSYCLSQVVPSDPTLFTHLISFDRQGEALENIQFLDQSVFVVTTATQKIIFYEIFDTSPYIYVKQEISISANIHEIVVLPGDTHMILLTSDSEIQVLNRLGYVFAPITLPFPISDQTSSCLIQAPGQTMAAFSSSGNDEIRIYSYNTDGSDTPQMEYWKVLDFDPKGIIGIQNTFFIAIVENTTQNIHVMNFQANAWITFGTLMGEDTNPISTSTIRLIYLIPTTKHILIYLEDEGGNSVQTFNAESANAVTSPVTVHYDSSTEIVKSISSTYIQGRSVVGYSDGNIEARNPLDNSLIWAGRDNEFSISEMSTETTNDHYLVVRNSVDQITVWLKSYSGVSINTPPGTVTAISSDFLTDAGLFPVKGKKKENLENENESRNNSNTVGINLHNIITNSFTRITLFVSRGLAIISISEVACLSNGFTLIKMIQIIEILSKLIYIPVKYSGLLFHILEAIQELGDPVTIPSSLIMGDDFINSHSSYRGKIFKYQEYGNIIQSIPVQSLIFIALDVIIWIAHILSKKIKLSKTVISKLHDLKLVYVETGIIDLSFYCILNMVVFFNFSDKFRLKNIINFLISVYILSNMVLMYLNLYSKLSIHTRLRGSKLSNIEAGIIFEGMLYKGTISIQDKQKMATINLLFKIQLLLIPVILVTSQSRLIVSAGILLLQLVCLFSFFKLTKLISTTKIFDSCMDKMSHFLLFGVITNLAIIGLVGEDWNESTISNNIDYNSSLFGVATGIMIFLSIFLEIIKPISRLIHSLMNKKSKNKVQEIQVNKPHAKLDMISREAKLKHIRKFIPPPIRLTKMKKAKELGRRKTKNLSSFIDNFGIKRPTTLRINRKETTVAKRIPNWDSFKSSQSKHISWSTTLVASKRKKLKNKTFSRANTKQAVSIKFRTFNKISVTSIASARNKKKLKTFNFLDSSL